MAFDPQGVRTELPPVPQVESGNRSPEEEGGVEVAERGVVDVVQNQVEVASAAPSNATVEVAQQERVKVVKDELLAEVEDLLADKKIAEIYKALPENKKQIFKVTGEQLAKDITDSIRGHKIKPYYVLSKIKTWLGLVPKVQKYFLWQEAKIDLDRVLNLAEEFETNEGNKV